MMTEPERRAVESGPTFLKQILCSHIVPIIIIERVEVLFRVVVGSIRKLCTNSKIHSRDDKYLALDLENNNYCFCDIFQRHFMLLNIGLPFQTTVVI